MKRNCIKSIRLKNFKNFFDITADFTSSIESEYPCLSFIYGGNGVGKSNLFSVFSFLLESSETTLFSPNINAINDGFVFKDAFNDDIENLGDNHCTHNHGLRVVIDKYKRLSSYGQSMEISVDFYYEGVEYIYQICTNDSEVTSENLSIRENVRLTNVYNVTREGIYISQRHIPNAEFKTLLFSDIKRSFGRHTFLAIIREYLVKSNISFLQASISKEFIHLFNAFNNIDIITDKHKKGSHYGMYRSAFLPNLLKGKIKNDEYAQKKFKYTIDFMTIFYKKYIPNISKINYRTFDFGEHIKYILMFTKKNAEGKEIEIPYDDESFGTISFTYLISCFYRVLMGETIILDDVYLGLHDSVLSHIFIDFAELESSFMKQNNFNGGQLIVIAQNTVYFKYKLRNNIYLLNNDKGQAYENSLLPLSFYNRDYQAKSNARNIYLNSNKKDASFSSYNDDVDLKKLFKNLLIK